MATVDQAVEGKGDELEHERDELASEHFRAHFNRMIDEGLKQLLDEHKGRDDA